MDKSVETFFTKNPEQGYIDQYEHDHGPRLDSMIERFDLKNIQNQKIVDVGGGLGFLGKRLNSNNDYTVIDGAEIPEDKKLCKGIYHKADLDYDKFSERTNMHVINVDVHKFPVSDIEFKKVFDKKFDKAFCLETLEHLSNPYHCLVEMKKLVKENGEIYISIPHINVTHNYIYPGLMADPQVFAQFLGQMALPVMEYWLWSRGWNAHHFKCRNAPWEESNMLFKKDEPKFRGKTPMEYVNL